MIVVDSSVWIDYFNGVRSRETDRLDALLGEELVIVGDLVLVEVLQGFRSDVGLRRAQSLLEALESRAMGGREIALAAVRSFRTLRAKGVTVQKTIDVVIGTYCIVNRLPLLHADRDFLPMEKHLGLQAVAR